MERKCMPFFLLVLILFSPQYCISQESRNQQTTFPEGISIEYGIGSFAVTDEYISKEKYSGALPYFSAAWTSGHSDYVYHLKIDFRSSSEIKNYNVTTDIYQFSLNQGFSYALPKFSIFNKDAYAYLGPSTELYFFFNEQNIAVSGFDYAQSIALLISAGLSSRIFYELWDDLNLEGSLDFGVISLGFRMVDTEETDATPVKILTLLAGTNLSFSLGPRYFLRDNLSVKAAYLFNFTRISSWEPLLSASDNLALTLTYGF